MNGRDARCHTNVSSFSFSFGVFFIGMIPTFVLYSILAALDASVDIRGDSVAAVVSDVISALHDLSPGKCDQFLTVFGLLNMVTEHEEDLKMNAEST